MDWKKAFKEAFKYKAAKQGFIMMVAACVLCIVIPSVFDARSFIVMAVVMGGAYFAMLGGNQFYTVFVQLLTQDIESEKKNGKK